MNQTVTKEDLQKSFDEFGESMHIEFNNLSRYITTAIDKLTERMDGLSSHMDEQFLEVNTKLDAIMSGEIMVTRKQVQRLITALETQGMKLNVSEILAA